MALLLRSSWKSNHEPATLETGTLPLSHQMGPKLWHQIMITIQILPQLIPIINLPMMSSSGDFATTQIDITIAPINAGIWLTMMAFLLNNIE